MPADLLDAQLADRPGSLRHASTTFELGRCCAREDCSTILSRYNPAAWCRIHEGEENRKLPVRLREWIGAKYQPPGPPEDHADPHFRCDACEQVYPMERQWIRGAYRFCVWCRPASATRSAALELLS